MAWGSPPACTDSAMAQVFRAVVIQMIAKWAEGR